MTTSESLASRTLTVVGIVFGFLLTLGLLYVTRNLLMLIFGAILIAVVLNRLAQTIGRFLPHAMTRGQRVTLLLGVLAVVTIGGIYGFANAAAGQIVQLNSRIDEAVDAIVDAAKKQEIVQRVLKGDTDVTSMLPSSSNSLGFAKQFFTSAFGGITDVLILFILSIYFCVNPEKYRVGIIRLVPLDWRDKLSALLANSADTLWHWMLGRLLAMVLVGLFFGFGLAIIGIPMPTELGAFAAVVTFVPNIGGIAAVIPALILAADQGKTSFIAVLILYLAIQFSESYFVTPKVQERQVSLPPALVILAQVIAGLIFGFWGVVFATPLVAVAVLWIRELYVVGYLEKVSPPATDLPVMDHETDNGMLA